MPMIQLPSRPLDSIDLTADVTGKLPIANGGTNSSTALSNNRVMKSAAGAIIEAAAITPAKALKSDANGIPTHFDTTTEASLTELSYVKGVTSAIQTQINSKLTTIQGDNYRLMATNGSATISEAAAITPSRALASDANGIPVASAATATELALLSGSLIPGTFTPTVTLVGGAGNIVPVYTTNSGRYTRFGHIVFCDILLTGDGGAEGAGSGQLTIALPVAASASALGNAFNVGHGQNDTFPGTSNFQLLGTLTGGGATIAISLYSAATTTAIMTGDDQNSVNRAIRLSFFYEV